MGALLTVQCAHWQKLFVHIKCQNTPVIRTVKYVPVLRYICHRIGLSHTHTAQHTRSPKTHSHQFIQCSLSLPFAAVVVLCFLLTVSTAFEYKLTQKAMHLDRNTGAECIPQQPPSWPLNATSDEAKNQMSTDVSTMNIAMEAIAGDGVLTATVASLLANGTQPISGIPSATTIIGSDGVNQEILDAKNASTDHSSSVEDSCQLVGTTCIEYWNTELNNMLCLRRSTTFMPINRIWAKMISTKRFSTFWPPHLPHSYRWYCWQRSIVFWWPPFIDRIAYDTKWRTHDR